MGWRNAGGSCWNHLTLTAEAQLHFATVGPSVSAFEANSHPLSTRTVCGNRLRGDGSASMLTTRWSVMLPATTAAGLSVSQGGRTQARLQV